MNRINLAAQKRLFEKWSTVPVGTPVTVRMDDGSDLRTLTRSEPWLLGHGAAVIKVDGITGGYLLDRVRTRPVAPAADADPDVTATVYDPGDSDDDFGSHSEEFGFEPGDR